MLRCVCVCVRAQGLATVLRDLHGEIRDSISSKKEEMDNSPQECARMDLIGYVSATPTQYSIIFPSQKIRQNWEDEFLQAKKMADNEALPFDIVVPPTSPFPAKVSVCEEFEFRNFSVVQSGRIGTMVHAGFHGVFKGGGGFQGGFKGGGGFQGKN